MEILLVLLISLVFFILLFIILFIIQSIKIRKLSAKPKNNVHFYVARDKNGELFLYMGKPFRGIEKFHEYQNGCIITGDNNFYNFNLNKNDFKNLKFEDKPVEVFLNLEN